MDYQCARLPSTVCIYSRFESQAEYVRFFTFDPARGSGSELLTGKMKKEDGPDFWNLSPDGKYLVTAKSQDPYQDPVLRIINLRQTVATGARRLALREIETVT